MKNKKTFSETLEEIDRINRVKESIGVQEFEKLSKEEQWENIQLDYFASIIVEMFLEQQENKN